MVDVRQLMAEAKDRIAASDPDLGRVRLASSVTVSVGTSLPIQLLLGSILGYGSRDLFASTTFGAVMAMLAANALVSKSRSAIVRAAVLFPISAAVGLFPATLAGTHRSLQIGGFAIMLFGAVWVRRFGANWFFYGFMAWVAFFFAIFLKATWTLLPELLLAAAISTVWVVILSTAVFHTNGRRVLQSTLMSGYSRGRAVARECVDLLDVRTGNERGRRRARRALAARLAGLAEVGLLVDAWSADPDALPEGWSAVALRRRMIETQQAVERFAGAAVAMAGASTELVAESRWALDHLAARRDLSALRAADRIDVLADIARESDDESWWPARHLAFGVREFLRFDMTAGQAPQGEPGEEEFESMAGLVFGELPGAAAVARDVPARASRWNPASRLSLNNRQAVQVTLAGLLALLIGTILSPTRYYWAVIAVFVTFTGTGTRAETFLKGSARIAGTVAGLGVALVIADLTSGHTIAIFTTIMLSIFAAFYLSKVSFAASTVFVTVLLGQLYTAIGTFTDELLEVRLGETAVGAAVGVLVATVFAPLSTRDTVRAARDDVLVALEGLLRGVASYVEGERVDLDALVRGLDDRARRIALAARPLTSALVVGTASRRTRRRLDLYTSAVTLARSLVVAVQRRPAAHPEITVTAARALADAVRSLLETKLGEPAPAAKEPLSRGDVALLRDYDPARDSDPVLRYLNHLSGMFAEIAEIGLTAPV
jgi:hypothetical protein